MFFLLTIILFSSLQVHGSPMFACDFEDGTMCDMKNGIWYDPQIPLYNFTVATGENVPDKELAPATDHTHNSSSGHYLYWHRPARSAHTSMDGRVSLPIFEQHKHLCLRFAYYINSSEVTKNNTMLVIYLKGCYTATLWGLHADDTQGWQTDEIQLNDVSCNVTISFDAWPDIYNAVSVALDDIVVDTCSRYLTTTTAIPSGQPAQFAINVGLSVFLLIILLVIV